ncbi:MAG: hypothetical protein OQL08_12400 [Gammaproteobacteria bacterium]|nr:hypothetical protein [Gammaproteobacteria bacterium]
MSNDSLQDVIDFLRNHATFDQMAVPRLAFLARRLRPVFFARDETVATPESGVADHLYIIRNGRIRSELPGQVGQPRSGSW